jgi:hypothetical protein
MSARRLEIVAALSKAGVAARDESDQLRDEKLSVLLAVAALVPSYVLDGHGP